jgi:hypothetical protein
MALSNIHGATLFAGIVLAGVLVPRYDQLDISQEDLSAKKRLRLVRLEDRFNYRGRLRALTLHECRRMAHNF